MSIDEELKLKILKWQEDFSEVEEEDEIDPDIGIEAIWLLDSVAFALREE